MNAHPIGDLGPLAQFHRALGDPVRLGMVALLAQRELCVCHLQAALGLPQSTTSRQLGTLRAAGIVETRRNQRWIHYRLARPPDPACAAQLGALVRRFRRSASTRAIVGRLTRELGPRACS